YWTKAECCGEPVNLVGPIVLLTNLTSDHISSALGKSPSWNRSAALAGSTRRSASTDSEAPDPATNLRRGIAIVSSTALLLSTAPNDPLSWATLSPSDQIVVRGESSNLRVNHRGVQCTCAESVRLMGNPVSLQPAALCQNFYFVADRPVD